MLAYVYKKKVSRPIILLQIFTSLVCVIGWARAADNIEFNIDVLDVKDRSNIDLSQFSQRDYIMPGSYVMSVHINQQIIPEQSIIFYSPDENPKLSLPCISPELAEQVGFKEEIVNQFSWWHEQQCLDLAKIKGVEARGDLSASRLYLSIPQAYLEYRTENWDPPSAWDHGITGMLFDYNVSSQLTMRKGAEKSYTTSGNGIVGANIGAWRLRADWQAQSERQVNSMSEGKPQLEWSRYYLYRAMPSLGAKLTLGEDFLNSDLFDSFRFTGASLHSDDNMLPPNLRGYAPEVIGIARTNARVIISQQDRVLYETQVAAGPFRIQDISDSVSGKLDVRVEERDGSVQTFQINTATIPYLSRPGSVRYKMALGKPSDWYHHTTGATFATAEFSWGVSNGWSLYGGGITGGDYNALSLGVGRDLMLFGALSFDITESRAQFPQQEVLTGSSYRLSYSKNFEQYDSQVTFAGYRFSERDFMTMGEFLAAREKNENVRLGSNKEMYTVRLNKQLRSLDVSTFFDYSHQTYWDQPTNDRYSFSLSRYFNWGKISNLNLSLSAYKNKTNNINDNGLYLSLSMPLGENGTISLNSSNGSGANSQSVNYYNQIDSHNNYQISSGHSQQGGMFGGYFSHSGNSAEINTNASYQENQFSSLGLSLQGGITVTAKGAALHRASTQGGTRLMIDTDGVAGVPVRGYGATINTNTFGKAVITDVNSYYRNSASIDLDNLADNVEATNSVAQATLTEGAIGYRQFKVIAGEKMMAIIRLADGSAPPFGATVINESQQETGIVSDEGSIYLTGINSGEKMTVTWSGREQCNITLPKILPSMTQSNLLLPCTSITENHTGSLPNNNG